MKHLVSRFLREEHGASMIEYAILASLISIAAIAVLVFVGDDVLALFQSAEGAMSSNM